MFQFQTGSIKRNDRMIMNCLMVVFQFQTGSIKRRIFFICNGKVRSIARFNSKLVRLKGKFSIEVIGGQMFQFQTGSIKSYSTKHHKTFLVSIPNWFD